ncbi:MAG: hypothetical protein WBP93_16815 [Pyrinomonadaceae bacterium]
MVVDGVSDRTLIRRLIPILAVVALAGCGQTQADVNAHLKLRSQADAEYLARAAGMRGGSGIYPIQDYDAVCQRQTRRRYLCDVYFDGHYEDRYIISKAKDGHPIASHR